MMFLPSINDVDVLNSNTGTTTFRPQQPLQSYDTTLHLQSNNNSITFACQQKSSINTAQYSLVPQQTNVSYSTSRHDLTSTNGYTSLYTMPADTSHNNNQTISNLIPLNITIFNPTLPPYTQTATPTSLVATQQFPQLSTIPNFVNYGSLCQKYVYKSKTEDGTLTTKALSTNSKIFNSTKTSHKNLNHQTNTPTTNINNTATQQQQQQSSGKPYYMNAKRVLRQQENLLTTNYIPTGLPTTTETNTLLLANTASTTPVFTTINPISEITPLSLTSIQPLHSPNTKTIGGLKKRRRRYKKPLELRKILPKNSLMLLHELRPNIEYRLVSQSGPIHRPIFTMSVTINDDAFEGYGKTKKEARMMAADKAVQFLMQNPHLIQSKSSSKRSNSTSATDKTEANDDETVNNDDKNENDDSVDDADSVHADSLNQDNSNTKDEINSLNGNNRNDNNEQSQASNNKLNESTNDIKNETTSDCSTSNKQDELI